jgi:GntR family transcriptional regulator
MDIALNRRADVPVKDQIRFQLELKILSGDLAPGQRLPSVRVLARRLQVHPNTVSAAYQDLQATGHVSLQRGSGVFVKPGAPTQPQQARGLDEMIRLALYLAFRRGYSGAEIRAAVERWLAAAPPDRIVVVDPSKEMGELLVHEVRGALGVAASSCAIADVERDAGLLSGALALVLPYHLESVARLNPSAAVETVTLEVAAEERAAFMALPAGSVVLLVSYSPTVLPFASVLLRSLRGDEVLVETRGLADAGEWQRLAPVADLVFADALAAPSVARARPRRLREIRLLSPSSLARLRDALTVVVPQLAGPAADGPGATAPGSRAAAPRPVGDDR